MTGTADTEAFEFQQIYHLETMVIPTNLPMIRKDENDLVFRTFQEKADAIVADIKDCYERSQPVLVGTTSIENSELLSTILQKQKLPHQVLNAKQHEREAQIVAQAGRPGRHHDRDQHGRPRNRHRARRSVEPQILKIREDETVPHAERDLQINNLRGDWKVRHDQVITAGGLHIVGTERADRRPACGTRGPARRSGLLAVLFVARRSAVENIWWRAAAGIMQRLKMPEGEPIEHPIVNRSIAKAQNRVESRNFDIRKQLLEYDNVANDQRRVIYQQRNELLETEDVSETIRNMIEGQIEDTVRLSIPPESVEEQWDIPALMSSLAADYQVVAPVDEWLKTEPELSDEDVRDRVRDVAKKQYEAKLELVGPEMFHKFERNLMLQTVDQHWREHLAALDHLRQGIHLRGYAQKNPKQEYKREAFELFSDMLDRIKQDVVKRSCLTVQVRSEEDVRRSRSRSPVSSVSYQHADYDQALGAAAVTTVAGDVPPPFTRAGEKVGRNDIARAERQEVQTLSRQAGLALGRVGLLRSRFAASVSGGRPGASDRTLPADHAPSPSPGSVAARASVAVALRQAGPRVRLRFLRRRDARPLHPAHGRPAAACSRHHARRHRAKIKHWNRDDLLLIGSRPGAVAAGVFTQNRFCAAPVSVCREHLAPARRQTRRCSSTPATPTPAPAPTGLAARAPPARRSRAARLRAATKCCRSPPA